jgi:hypothetical protein
MSPCACRGVVREADDRAVLVCVRLGEIPRDTSPAAAVFVSVRLVVAWWFS